MTQTKKANLINPEVLANVVSAQMQNAIRFTPYAVTDDTLVGQPGDTITRPKYAYIGAAEDLQEGVAMDTTQMSMTTTKVTVKETGKAVEVTQTAVITNVNGTLQEASRQLAMSLADKVEIDYIAELNKSKQTATVSADATGILDAIEVFNSENDEDYVLYVNPKDYNKLVKSLFKVGGNVQDRAISKGDLVEIVGVSDIVKSKRVSENTAFLQRYGAMEIVNKKKPEAYTDFDILKRTHLLSTNYHYSVNLKDETGVVKVTFKPAGSLEM
ncbi:MULTISPECIES: N4-gp56 family major capsid protein [Staphylococcus]|uniref:N4-gp56 family major capsid protein n=1 Tax=Staphylococcus TaxID=1279 RepID=UPI0011C9B842|nr:MULTISPECIES: N4-gp56 family major capsid protein [Staphylococcus]MBE5662489.1 N4-gp56 family major capsid protein [Staphylococcus singaporensis]EKF1403473.1 N4-gp56 family major capsid protein [Staphylococcus aureus]MDD9479999.1 N4-gp56 family major capsid protein [Staphylococcus aureus]MDD9496190.1 N4-gp56 family major capsid protein [Staphylococcus aureus]MDT3799112.1 N4-gp56 family major capsid protein [Staphylococcus aureus]